MIATATLPPLNEQTPRCKEHRHHGPGQMLDACWRCDEVAKWVAAQNAEREAELRRVLRDCPMCDGAGQRWDPDTHVSLSPLRTCDHVTAHTVVVAELRQAEVERERSAAVPRVLAPVPSSERGRARARALYLAEIKRRRTIAGTDGLEEDTVGLIDTKAVAS